MPQILKIGVENADELLNAGAYDAGALLHVQSAAAEAGAFADLTGTGSTPTIALVSGTRIHTVYDPAGDSSTWYRYRVKNAGGTRLGEWSAAFQWADEAGGLLCSLYDARQRLFPTGTTDSTEDENILGFIRQATQFIHTKTGRRFTPYPGSGTVTLLFSPGFGSGGVEVVDGGRTLLIPMGVRSLSSLGYAVSDQPTSGGVYTTITSSQYAILPGDGSRSPGWPATWVTLLSTTGALFTRGINRIQATGGFGFASVPADIERVALNLVVAAHREKGISGGDSVTINIDGSRTFERALSFMDRMTLQDYRVEPV